MSYLGHEFMPEYAGPPIGTDFFGVWSDWWKEYFLKNAKIYPKGGIEVSGSLKKMAFKNSFEQSSSLSTQSYQLDIGQTKIINVYIVSENHLPVSELLPYLNQLVKMESTRIAFKIRPFGTDIFWNALTKHGIYDKTKFTCTNAPTPDCFLNADVVIGTHSTAILEALWLNKPILVLNTKKWGDYFDLQNSRVGKKVWVNDPSELIEKIRNLEQNQTSDALKELWINYFSQQSGSDWIIEKINTN
jgi:hypothetical protein